MINRLLSILRIASIRACLALLFSAFLMGPGAAWAHNHVGKSAKDHKEHVKKDKKHKEKDAMSAEEEIMREISFLAKKLLDIKGKDALTLSSPAVVKPFIGICHNIISLGVKLTCITPKSQADKNGLKTGDIVQAINGISMEGDFSGEMHPFWPVMKQMKTGDVLKMDILRAGEEIKLNVPVGSLSHPAFELKINR